MLTVSNPNITALTVTIFMTSELLNTSRERDNVTVSAAVGCRVTSDVTAY